MPRNKEGSTRIKNGKLYARVTYQNEIGKTKEIWRKAENRTHAKELIKQLLRTLDDYGSKPIESEYMTFAELANYYVENYLQKAEYIEGRKISGLRSYDTAQYSFKPVKEYFGNKQIRKITYGDVKKYRLMRLKTPTKTGKQRSIATVNRELTYLRRALEIAKQQGWIISNPFDQGDSLISLADEQKRERILTKQEEIRLLEACTGLRSHLKTIIICAVDTGMRRGEIFKLKWQDINLLTSIITVQASNTKILKERQIAMTSRLHSQLLSLFKSANHKLNDLVFGIKTSCKKAFDKLRKFVGLENLRFHDLRHTAATRMIQQGEVGRILGHTQAQTTYRYINANIDTARRAALALDAFHQQQNDFGQDEEKIN